MFNKAKDKTKTVSLKLQAKVNNTKTGNMAADQTVLLTKIPIVDTHGVIAPLQDIIPRLYAAGKAPKSSERTTVKKSLRFDDNSDIPPALILSATPPEISPARNEAEEEIIEHDTATQTALTVPIMEGVSDQGSVTTARPVEMTATDTSESPEEGAALPTTPSQGVAWPL